MSDCNANVYVALEGTAVKIGIKLVDLDTHAEPAAEKEPDEVRVYVFPEGQTAQLDAPTGYAQRVGAGAWEYLHPTLGMSADTYVAAVVAFKGGFARASAKLPFRVEALGVVA